MDPVFSLVPAFKDTRLPSLYSDFGHLKDLNPEGYEANVQAWSALLVQCLNQHTFGSSFTLPGGKLETKLSHPAHGAPKMLSGVLDILVQEKKFLPLSIYKRWPIVAPQSFMSYLSPSNAWQRSVGSFKTALFSSKGTKNSVNSEVFVHWPTLVAQADSIYTQAKAKAEKSGQATAVLLDFPMWLEFLQGIDPNLSPDDIDALTVYLSRDCGKLSTAQDPQNSERTLIKLDKGAISEDDIGIINVKTNVDSIQKRISSLEDRLNREIPARLKELLSSSSKDKETRLKNTLRRKVATVAALDRASSLLGKLTDVLDSINEAQSNAAVFESLRSAKSVLASYNEKVSLDDISSLTDELNEQMTLTNEISDGLTLPSADDEELEKELQELEKEHERMSEKGKEPEKSEETEALPNLPEPVSGKIESTDSDLASDLANLNIKSESPDSAEKTPLAA